jgi:ribonuclease P/MRP protein subunit POP5
VSTVKHLPKHLRPRYRYLGVRVESWPDADLTRDGLQAAVWRAARALVGDAGSADLDLSVFRLAGGAGGGDCVIRVRRGEVERARACLACVDEVDGSPVGIRVRGVAGTVRACEERYIRRPGEESDVRRVAFAGADRDART